MTSFYSCEHTMINYGTLLPRGITVLIEDADHQTTNAAPSTNLNHEYPHKMALKYLSSLLRRMAWDYLVFL